MKARITAMYSALPSLRLRLLAAAVLPAALVAVALSAFLLDREHAGLEDAMQARALATGRQIASAAEFGVFSGNSDALQSLIHSMQAGDADISGVAILDQSGKVLAVGGRAPMLASSEVRTEEHVVRRPDAIVVVTPIRRSRLSVDDIYSGSMPGETRQIDGAVIMELSRRNLDAERNRQLAIGIAVAFTGLLLAIALARRIARSVTGPILDINDVVERIGQGDLGARVRPDPDGVMADLEQGINAMAERIGASQESLRLKIESATAELRERKDEAERANLAKTRFLAAASHDLRQPLQAINLFHHALRDTPLSDEQRRISDFMAVSAQSLGELLNALLDVSRLDAGAVRPNVEKVGIAAYFASFYAKFSPLADARALTLRLRFPRNDLAVLTDPKLLQSLLANLIGNAIKYTERGGVLVAVRQRRGRVLVQVWDTGVGIAPEHIHAIFDEYFQIGNPERDRSKGLGLGLAIARRLAGLLDADLMCRSRPGRGSVFEFHLPLAGDE